MRTRSPASLRRFSTSFRLALLGLAVASAAPAQKFDGLALTPPMGWNTWNTFHSNINEALIKETADIIVASGMRDAGYTYVVIDDTWSLRERDADGNLVPDPQKFPSGMKALADYVHAKGLKLGLYSCAGEKTCGGYPGSWGHEFQDARLFASWGIDYLKYDWCNSGTANARDAYKRIRDALFAAKRPVVLSICEWGHNKPWEWGGEIGHLWRTTGDIYDSYDGRKAWEMGWKRILDLQATLVESTGQNDGLEKHAGPGGWNDPDMLEVGNAGLSLAESRAHFSLWCMLAAPLMAGNDLRQMTPEIRAILTNRDVIAVNQDPAGKQGFRALNEPAKNIEIWAKPLSDGEWALCALNTAQARTDLTVDWHRFHFLRGEYDVRDLWAKTSLGDTSRPHTASVDSHDVLLVRLTPKK